MYARHISFRLKPSTQSQLSDYQDRQADISKQMQKIEEELFLLSARSGEADSEKNRRVGRLRRERTRLASQLLLNELL